MTNRMQKYITEMLTHIADELNVKQVRIEFGNTLLGTFNYDTISQKPNGFDEDKWELGSTILTGNVIEDMKYVRHVISQGLSMRSDNKVKVRQPLQSITLQAKYL